jgi:hypothetical protein
MIVKPEQHKTQRKQHKTGKPKQSFRVLLFVVLFNNWGFSISSAQTCHRSLRKTFVLTVGRDARGVPATVRLDVLTVQIVLITSNRKYTLFGQRNNKAG